MAQALLTNYIQEQRNNYPIQEYQVLSAGIHTVDGLTASDEAIMVLAEENIELCSHRSRRLNEILMRQADYILTMSVSQKEYLKNMFPDLENIETIKQFAAAKNGDIVDPYGQGAEAYKQCLNEINTLIPGVFTRIFM
jgi:protein-tyrosine-phosphatase